MIQLVFIIVSIFSVVIGVYTIILLHTMRNIYKSYFLHSLFYFQILSFIFGVYGIIGSLLIRQILPKFELSSIAVETISHFIPLIGLPFLIAAWFMQIKFITEVCKKKIPKGFAFAFFSMAMVALLVLSYYVFKLSEIKTIEIQAIRKNLFLVFGLISLVFEGYMVVFLLANSVLEQDKQRRLILLYLFLILGGVSLFKAITLLFSQAYLLSGVYFILIYFSATLPIVLFIKKNLKLLIGLRIKPLNLKEQLFEKFYITPREQEIILEICKGKTNKEISGSLFITLQTVKDHAHNIFQKTGVKNRVQLSQLFSAG